MLNLLIEKKKKIIHNWGCLCLKPAYEQNKTCRHDCWCLCLKPAAYSHYTFDFLLDWMASASISFSDCCQLVSPSYCCYCWWQWLLAVAVCDGLDRQWFAAHVTQCCDVLFRLLPHCALVCFDACIALCWCDRRFYFSFEYLIGLKEPFN